MADRVKREALEEVVARALYDASPYSPRPFNPVVLAGYLPEARRVIAALDDAGLRVVNRIALDTWARALATMCPHHGAECPNIRNDEGPAEAGPSRLAAS